MVLDSNDNPHICYYDGTNEDLKYSYYNGNQWIIDTIDSQGNVGMYTSMDIDTNDNVHISYYDSTNGDLKYAVMDNILPTITSDNSPQNGTTGDPYQFNISVSDNLFVDTVHVKYKHGDLEENISLSKVGGYWLGNITLDHDIGDLVYTICAKDMAGNYNSSGELRKTVLDNDRPSIVNDLTSPTGNTGDPFIFEVQTSDNVAVGAVWVNWSHGGSGGNVSLDGNGEFWSRLVHLNHSLSNASYRIFVNDTSDNFNISEQKEITVSDNDDPVVDTDDSPVAGSTGDTYGFNLTITDNIALDTVTLGWSHGELDGEIELEPDGDRWQGTVVLDHSVEGLSYTVYINDTSDNRITHQRVVPVLDNDLPVFVEDLTAGTATTGDDFHLSVNVTDNIDVSEVLVSVSYGNGTEQNCSMVRTGKNIWNATISIPPDATSVEYYFIVLDDAGNRVESIHCSKPVGDDDTPTAEAGDDVTIDQHEFVLFDANGSLDNVGIVDHEWSIDTGGTIVTLSGMVVNHTFDAAGTYNVTLTVTDGGGLQATDNITVTVRDITPPSVDAGSDITIGQGTTALFDGGGSSDNVDIDNFTWYFIYDTSVVRCYGKTEEYLFEIPGVYLIKLMVTDVSGNAGTDNLTLYVSDTELPVARAIINGEDALDGNRYEFDANSTICFNAEGSHDNVGVTNHTWEITGKGTDVRVFDRVAEHTFTESGTYFVTIMVMDEAGNSCELVFSIGIGEEPGDDDTTEPNDDTPDDDDNGTVDGHSGTVMGIVLVSAGGALGVMLLVFLLVLRSRKGKADNCKAVAVSVMPEEGQDREGAVPAVVEETAGAVEVPQMEEEADGEEPE